VLPHSTSKQRCSCSPCHTKISACHARLYWAASLLTVANLKLCCKLSTSAAAATPLCTGVVQALHAVLNKVTIEPTQLLMRTDIYRQSFTIMLRNPANAAVTYAISHAPAVTIAVDKAWYRAPYDVNAPTADVTLSSTSVTVPAAGSAQVQVCCGASGRTSLQTVVCCGVHASKGCMSH
jgi:hypothetical protein